MKTVVDYVLDELIAIEEAVKECKLFTAYAIYLDFEGDKHSLTLEDRLAAEKLLYRANGAYMPSYSGHQYILKY